MSKGERIALAFVLVDVATIQLVTSHDHSAFLIIAGAVSWLIKFTLAGYLFVTAWTRDAG